MPIKAMIDKTLENTSVTVVCVTYSTVNRKYIDYEIDQSLARGNGLVAVQIHNLKDQNGETGSPGSIPSQIEANGLKRTSTEPGKAWLGGSKRLQHLLENDLTCDLQPT